MSLTECSKLHANELSLAPNCPWDAWRASPMYVYRISEWHNVVWNHLNGDNVFYVGYTPKTTEKYIWTIIGAWFITDCWPVFFQQKGMQQFSSFTLIFKCSSTWNMRNVGCRGCSRSVTPLVHSACYQTEVASCDIDQRHIQMKHLILTHWFRSCSLQWCHCGFVHQTVNQCKHSKTPF